MGHDLFDQRRLVGALDGRTLVRKSFELRRLHLPKRVEEGGEHFGKVLHLEAGVGLHEYVYV